MAIHGLGPVKKKKKEDGEKDSEEFGVGGKSSGTAVIRKKKTANNEDLIDLAKNNENDPAVSNKNIGLITIYRNGFTVGNGPFRDNNAPENKEFLDDLRSGNVPKELEKEAKEFEEDGGNFSIQMINKMTEDYKEPPKKFEFSKSKGNKIEKKAEKKIQGFDKCVANESVVDSNGKKTVIQIVTKKGEKKRVSININRTVFELYEHVMFLTGEPNGFILKGGFPPKSLTDPSVTIGDAKLGGSRLMMK